MGTTEMTVNALNPEEAYSPEHWLNSFGLATLIASGRLSAASNQILTKPTLTQPKPAVTIPKSQKTTKTQLIPFRTDYIKGKMDKALEQIGKVKVPVLVKEELATEFGSLSMLRMETKRLQDTQLQLFKGNGIKGKDNVKQGDKSSLAPGGGLAAHELKGGHLIDRHVGKTDGQLLERLKNNPKITGSSTFKGRMTAEKVADTVLRDPKNIKKI